MVFLFTFSSFPAYLRGDDGKKYPIRIGLIFSETNEVDTAQILYYPLLHAYEAKKHPWLGRPIVVDEQGNGAGRRTWYAAPVKDIICRIRLVPLFGEWVRPDSFLIAGQIKHSRYFEDFEPTIVPQEERVEPPVPTG
jgi:hypothetical protein